MNLLKSRHSDLDKLDLDKRIKRYQEFYSKDAPALLVHVRCIYNEKEKKIHPSFANHDIHKKNGRAEWFEHLFKEVIDENMLHPLDDDFIPAGKIQFGTTTSFFIKDRPVKIHAGVPWADHFLENLDELDFLQFRLDKDNFWWQLYSDAKKYLVSKLGDFVTPSAFAGILDLAHEIRGSSIYTDLLLEPDKAKPDYQ